MALATVTQYVSAARNLLQDTIGDDYRYSDTELVLALSLAMYEIRRLRPDILIETATTPSFSTVDSTAVDVDEQYRLAVLYFMCGYAQVRDDEESQDTRATAFLNKAVGIMTGIA